MKTPIHKYLVMIGGVLAPAMVLAQTGFMPGVPDGSYRGKFRGLESGRVHLLTQSIRGCEGCFIAVLFKNKCKDKKIEAYKAMPTKNQMVQKMNTSSEYDLIPLGVDTDGEITTPNDNPSSTLMIQKNVGTNSVEFNIVSANSGNTSATQSSMIFTGGISGFDLDDGEAGRYKIPMRIRSQGSISILSENPQDGSRSASATLLGDERNPGGSFSLKEKAPGVFTFSAVAHLATGAAVKQSPEKIVIFMKRMGRERAYLINPKQSTDISVLKVMN